MEFVTSQGKLSSANRSSARGDCESRGLATSQLPKDSISRILVSGTLALIFVTIAILIHDDMRQDNELTRGSNQFLEPEPPNAGRWPACAANRPVNYNRIASSYNNYR
jgi:hypothetical protein